MAGSSSPDPAHLSQSPTVLYIFLIALWCRNEVMNVHMSITAADPFLLPLATSSGERG